MATQNDNKKVTGLPAGQPKSVVQRRPQGGGKAKLDKHGHLQPENTTGK